jgi:predicted nucleic-acid-binding Zn-ribbon protein
MIFYGWGRKSVTLANIGNATCSHCGDVRPFQVLINYTYMHLYWIFGAVLRRKYMVVCSNCSHGFFIDKKQVNESIPKTVPNPIPFMQQWGLAVFAAGIALAIWIK